MTNYEAKMEFHQRKGRQQVRQFQVGEKVLVRNHTNKPKWISGNIITKVSNRTYTINIGHREVKRHIDHIARNHGSVSISQAENDFSWEVHGYIVQT